MINGLFDSLLTCTDCAHSVGIHSGNGCDERRCTCPKTKEQALEVHIASSFTERREMFEVPQHRGEPGTP